MPVNTTALRALCWSLLYGVDKVPDKWFDKVPGGYYRGNPSDVKARLKWEKEQQEAAQNGQARRHQSDDHDDRNHQSDSERPSRRSDRSQRQQQEYYNQEYDQDEDPRGYGGRRKSVGDRAGYDGAYGEYGQPRAYNPAEFGGAVAGGAAGEAYADDNRPGSSGPTGSYVPYANLYSPTGNRGFESDPRYSQDGRQAHYDQGGRDDYRQRESHHPGAYGNQEYDYDDRDQRHARRGSGRGGRTYSDSRSRSRSRSRSSEEERPRRRHRKRGRSRSGKTEVSSANKPRAKSSIRDKFDLSERGLGYGGIGAIAGGLLGSEVGKGVWPAVAGAVIGGLGANAFETREKDKESRMKGAVVEGRRDSHRGERDRGDRDRGDRDRGERDRGERDRGGRGRGDRDRSNRDRGDGDRSDRDRSVRDRGDRDRSDRERVDRDRQGERQGKRSSRYDGYDSD